MSRNSSHSVLTKHTQLGLKVISKRDLDKINCTPSPDKYQQYLKDNQNRIKETYPELTNTQRFSKLAEEWNEYKKTIVNVNVTETTEETTE